MNYLAHEEAYALLENSVANVCVQGTDGCCYELSEYLKDYRNSSVDGYFIPINIFPGSFNPLHDAHRYTFNIMKEDKPSLSFFEICTFPFGKSKLTPEELSTRLKQFVGVGPVILTSAPRFVEKIGAIKQNRQYILSTFYIGADTLGRMAEDYGAVGINGLNSQFVVFDRINTITNQTRTLYTESLEVIPSNCVRDLHTRSEQLLRMSSTEIREKRSR